jgi:hypothetical protein
MNLQQQRLVLAVGLYLAWMAYMGYLVATRPQIEPNVPLVLSSPQIVASQVDIIATIDDPEQPLTVEEVLWPADATIKAGDKIRVENIAESGPRNQPGADFRGKGRYLLPLRAFGAEKTQRWFVAEIPDSPGFSPARAIVRIYPANSESLAQYRRIGKGAKK